MIEMGCFRELNTFGPQGCRPPDLDWSQAPESPKRSLLDRILRRNVRLQLTYLLTDLINYRCMFVCETWTFLSCLLLNCSIHPCPKTMPNSLCSPVKAQWGQGWSALPSRDRVSNSSCSGAAGWTTITCPCWLAEDSTGYAAKCSCQGVLLPPGKMCFDHSGLCHWSHTCFTGERVKYNFCCQFSRCITSV